MSQLGNFTVCAEDFESLALSTFNSWGYYLIIAQSWLKITSDAFDKPVVFSQCRNRVTCVPGDRIPLCQPALTLFAWSSPVILQRHFSFPRCQGYPGHAKLASPYSFEFSAPKHIEPALPSTETCFARSGNLWRSAGNKMVLNSQNKMMRKWTIRSLRRNTCLTWIRKASVDRHSNLLLVLSSIPSAPTTIISYSGRAKPTNAARQSARSLW